MCLECKLQFGQINLIFKSWFVRYKVSSGYDNEKIEKCKSSLYFLWSHVDFDLAYLKPEILAAVETYQQKLRVTEELLILEAEMDQLVKYVKEFITKPGNEWLHLYISEACDSQILLSQDSSSSSSTPPFKFSLANQKA